MAKISGRLTGNYHSTIYQIADISDIAIIDTLVLGLIEALFITLRISLKWSWGD